MKKKYLNLLLIVGLIVTVFGIITGRYLFLFLVIPIGIGWFRSDK